MNNELSGINEAALGELSLEILDYADRISEIFRRIDEKMHNLNQYYKGSCYDDLLNYYEQFRQNYAVIKENIVSYSDDLIAAIKHMNEIDINFAKIYSNLEDETKEKTKIIEKL